MVDVVANGADALESLSEYRPDVVVLDLMLPPLHGWDFVERSRDVTQGEVLLERGFRPITAVALSSTFFALYHGPTQGFAPSKLFFYFVVGVVFGAIAWRTNSVLPALPVHVAGDLVFFTLIWPQDPTRSDVWRDGADTVFWERGASDRLRNPRMRRVQSIVEGASCRVRYVTLLK